MNMILYQTDIVQQESNCLSDEIKMECCVGSVEIEVK